MAVNARGIWDLWCTAENHINKKTKCPSWLDWLNPAHWWPDKKTCPFPGINRVYLSPSCFTQFSSVQFSSVTQSCPTLQPYELQHARLPCPSPTPRVHSNSCPSSWWCHTAISSSGVPFSSCPQSLPESVFSNESTLCMRWPKYWSFSFNISPSKEHPGLISFRMDWLDLLAVQGTLKSLIQHHSSKASIFWCSAFSQSNSHIHTWPLEKP